MPLRTQVTEVTSGARSPSPVLLSHSGGFLSYEPSGGGSNALHVKKRQNSSVIHFPSVILREKTSLKQKAKVEFVQSCPTLCDPMDYPGQKLEWVAFPFSRGSPQPRDRTQVSHVAGGFFTRATRRDFEYFPFFSPKGSPPCPSPSVNLCICRALGLEWSPL